MPPILTKTVKFSDIEMALWLFRRKSRRKRTRNDMETDLQRGSAAAAAPVKPIGKPSRHRSIQKKPHTETRKLQRRVRHSFESGRPDHLDIAGANGPGATSGAHFPVGYFYAAAGTTRRWTPPATTQPSGIRASGTDSISSA